MRTKIPVNLIQITIGLTGHLLGLLIYTLYRPPESSYLGIMIHQFIGIIPFKISVPEIIGGCQPDFLHPFAFVLICMAMFPNATQRQRGLICLFWLFTIILFGIGQLYGDQIGRFMSFSEFFNKYFTGGTYDVLDIITFTNTFYLYLSGEYHDVEYSAKVDWNLRQDFQHPRSFVHDADGEGITLKAGLEKALNKQWTMGLNYNKQKWSTDPGIDRVYFTGGTSSETRLNEVVRESEAINLSVVYRF